MQRILVFTPAFVSKVEHLGMLRVQALLAARMRAKGLNVISALVCDYVADEFVSPVAEVGRLFDVSIPALPKLFPGNDQWGIRRPTNFAIQELVEDCGFILRVIQDTFVERADRFCDSLAAALETPGHWVAANLHHWETSGHGWLCDLMGLPFATHLTYPNGAVMIAPANTWRRFYLPLPSAIHHHWDDVMMGEWLKQEGGTLIDLDLSWTHLHDCPAEVSRECYLRHLQETSGLAGRQPDRPAALPWSLPPLEC